MEFVFKNTLFQESLIMPKRAESGEKTTYPGFSYLVDQFKKLGLETKDNKFIKAGKTIVVLRYSGTGGNSFGGLSQEMKDDSVIIAISKKGENSFDVWQGTCQCIGAKDMSWSPIIDPILREKTQYDVNKVIVRIVSQRCNK